MPGRRLFAVAALVATVSAACGGGTAAPATTVPPPACPADRGTPVGTIPPTFPLHVDTAGRHLVDAAGRPFLIQGDAPWSIGVQLTRDDVQKYLDDRKAKGFNTILVNLLEHKFSSNAPANLAGDQPFTTKDDFSTPNPAYFDNMDWVIDQAEQRDMLVLLTPEFLGYRGSDEGWYQAVVANGPDKMREYGRWIARRFAAHQNIVWVQGGDYNLMEKELIDEVAGGVKDVLPDALQTAHVAPDYLATEVFGDRSWLDLNTTYASGDAYPQALRAFQHSSLPFFLIETVYENMYGITQPHLRRQAYSTLLTGATGQVFGNDPIWHFDGPGLNPPPTTWQAALDSPGSLAQVHLHALFRDLRWWLIRPDLGSFVVDGGEGESVVAGVACDGSFALAYVPSVRVVRLDPKVLAPGATLSWFDPTAGTVVPASPSAPDGQGRVAVQPPGPNAEGTTDWILVAKVAS